MSCFWKGILDSMSEEFKNKNKILNNPASLLQYFKKKNDFLVFYRKTNTSDKLVPVVCHQGEPLSASQVFETVAWIESYDPSLTSQGHWTSTCDPFLCLYTALADCSIVHNYLGQNMVRYTNNFDHYGTCLEFQSDSGHFWFKNKKNNCQKKIPNTLVKRHKKNFF